MNSQPISSSKYILHLALNLFILIGAMLIAIQLRYDLRYGKTLGSKYDAQPLELYVIILSSAALTFLISWISQKLPLTQHFLHLDRPLRMVIIATAITSVSILTLLPNISQLQIVYFVTISVVLGFALIFIPNRLRLRQNLSTNAINLQRLWQTRSLIILWMRYNVQARYTQSFLGIAWLLFVPLATGAVMALAFSVFLRIRLDVPFLVFLFSGLTGFYIFRQGVSSSTNSIRSSLGIIKNASFPREILVFVTLGEILIDTFFMIIAMIFLNILYGFYPSLLFVFLIPIFLIMSIFTLGIMLLVSYLSVLVRDIPQLVGVILQFMFYLTPIIYPIDRIPSDYQFIFLINPLAPLIGGIRDIVIYERVPDLFSLVYPLVAGLILLYIGYTLFKANEDILADMV